MYFNIDKCKSLYFDGRNESSTTVILDGNEIPIVNCIKDLGIYIQSSIMERPHSGEVSGSSQVFLISETHHAS